MRKWRWHFGQTWLFRSTSRLYRISLQLSHLIQIPLGAIPSPAGGAGLDGAMTDLSSNGDRGGTLQGTVHRYPGSVKATAHSLSLPDDASQSTRTHERTSHVTPDCEGTR